MSFLLTQEPVQWIAVLTAFFGAYLSGSVPYGLILGKMAGLGDIRNAGSGNIGATNALRIGGKKLGAATLLLDMLKGLVPVLIAKQIHMDYAVVAALGAFTGHLFPVWLKFKGGKGVAVAIGVMLALWWQLGAAIICVWLLTAMISKYSSLAALVAFGLAPMMALLLTHQYQMTIVTFIISIVIWIKHKDNIRRLAKGAEGKINLGSKK
jgi:acyl phosphate:glycerol-3-phosphate acyltransferase